MFNKDRLDKLYLNNGKIPMKGSCQLSHILVDGHIQFVDGLTTNPILKKASVEAVLL